MKNLHFSTDKLSSLRSKDDKKKSLSSNQQVEMPSSNNRQMPSVAFYSKAPSPITCDRLLENSAAFSKLSAFPTKDNLVRQLLTGTNKILRFQLITRWMSKSEGGTLRSRNEGGGAPFGHPTIGKIFGPEARIWK
jgi:hypothetical protein